MRTSRLSASCKISEPHELKTGDTLKLGVDVTEHETAAHKSVTLKVHVTLPSTGDKNEEEIEYDTSVPLDVLVAQGETAMTREIRGLREANESYKTQLQELSVSLNELASNERNLSSQLHTISTVLNEVNEEAENAYFGVQQEDKLLSRIDAMESQLSFYMTRHASEESEVALLRHNAVMQHQAKHESVVPHPRSPSAMVARLTRSGLAVHRYEMNAKQQVRRAMEEKTEVMQKMKEVQHSLETAARDHEFALSRKDLELTTQREENTELRMQIQKLREAATELAAKVQVPGVGLNTTLAGGAGEGAAAAELGEGVGTAGAARAVRKMRELQPAVQSGVVSIERFFTEVLAAGGGDAPTTAAAAGGEAATSETKPLLAELDALREQLSAANQGKKDAESEVKNLQTLIAAEKASLATAQERIATLLQETDSAAQAADRARSTQSELEKRVALLEGEAKSVGPLSKTNAVLSSRVAELEAGLSELESLRAAAKTTEELQAKVSDLEASRKSLERSLAQASKATADGAAAKEALGAATQERDALAKKVAALEKTSAHTALELKTAHDAMKRLKRESKNISRIASEETKIVKEHESQVASLESTIETLRAQLSESSNGAVAAPAPRADDGQNAQLRDELSRAQALLSTAQGEVASLKRNAGKKARSEPAPHPPQPQSHVAQVASFVVGGIAVAAYFLAVAPQPDSIQ